MSNLIPPKAPNLPIPTTSYERAYLEEFTKQLRLYFNQVDSFAQNINVPQNGTTANRPVANLQVGQFYFDTTLGIPIWYNGTVWKNASGTTV